MMIEPIDPRDFCLLGVGINRATMAQALDWIEDEVRSKRRRTVQFVNAHCLNLAALHRSYRRVLSHAERVFADGSGIRYACRVLKLPEPDNVNGTDMLPLLCERAARSGLRLFFLGAQPGVAAAAAQALAIRYPGLQVAGTYHGHFTDQEEAEVVAAINASGAQVVLVGMGVPRQELWIDRNRDRLDAELVMGVGGLFDFYSGRIPRAPRWLRSIGFEWVWRLIQEPGRMWRRYVVGNPVFLVRVLAQRSRIRTQAEAAVRRLNRFASPASLRLMRWRFRLRTTVWRLGVWASLAGKRGGDIVAAVVLLALLTPLFAVVAALIRLESPGPVLFRQTRVGLHGKLFTIWKFRSMYIDAEARRESLDQFNQMQGGVTFKMKRDPRITRVGRFIRKASIDELPQLWNVLVGDMSLVGPRPPLPNEVATYTLSDRRRLDGVPGITCLWQVSGRSNIPFQQQVMLDVQYLESRSLLSDLIILFKTIPAVLTGRGAL